MNFIQNIMGYELFFVDFPDTCGVTFVCEPCKTLVRVFHHNDSICYKYGLKPERKEHPICPKCGKQLFEPVMAKIDDGFFKQLAFEISRVALFKKREIGFDANRSLKIGVGE